MASDLKSDGFGPLSETMPKPFVFWRPRNRRNHRETIAKPHRNHAETTAPIATETTETPVYKTGFVVSHPGFRLAGAVSAGHSTARGK